jgi:hypothetical protein
VYVASFFSSAGLAALTTSVYARLFWCRRYRSVKPGVVTWNETRPLTGSCTRAVLGSARDASMSAWLAARTRAWSIFTIWRSYVRKPFSSPSRSVISV